MRACLQTVQGGQWRSRKSIYVGGIGDQRICGSDAGLRDSWIFLLHVVDHDDHDDVTVFRLNSSLIRITLPNIDRIEALVSSQPQVARGKVATVRTLDWRSTDREFDSRLST